MALYGARKGIWSGVAQSEDVLGVYYGITGIGRCYGSHRKFLMINCAADLLATDPVIKHQDP